MKVFSLMLAALAVSASCLCAGEPIKDGVTPEAYQFLKTVSEFHAGLVSAQADLQLAIVQEVPGQPKKEDKMKASFAIERPRLFRLNLDGDEGGLRIVCDGQSVWTYLPALKQFTVDTAPMNLEILLRHHPVAPKAMSQLGPLCELFRKDPATLILAPVSILKVVGTETIDGTECLRLHGEQDNMDWDAWFQKGGQPVLRRYTFNPLKGMRATASEESRRKLEGVKLEVTVDYAWKIDAPAAPDAFTFATPQGAQKVEQFHVARQQPPSPGGGGGGHAALKGKPAPDFTLDTLDGGKVHLADLKGKVVVLDFWATWCGPCVQALPEIAALTKARQEKGVVFIAVNQQEEAAEIKEFLKSKNLDFSVALDVEGKAAQLYQVQGIPQTVVIDRAGNVAEVHVGFSPVMKELLSRELDELLAK